MLFAIGTKVKFLHTGDEGVVTSLFDNGMVNVYIRKEDMEIPAFPDDLIRAEEFMAHPVKAKFVEGKKEVSRPEAPPVNIQTQYTILKSLGIQLAFEPVESGSGVPDKFLIHLINDTQYEVVYSIRFMLNYKKTVTWDGKLKATTVVLLGAMLNDDLNEAPEFDIECRWVSTEGLGEPAKKNLKIKPKTFFSNVRTAPLLNKQVHLYKLFERPGTPDASGKSEDLKDYTKRNSKPSWQFQTNLQNLDFNDSKELAEFEPVIDLHIEKLTDKWQKMGNAEILRLQLSHFETYLSKAIQLGVPGVFVIHGVGKGRLRNEIATRLMNNPDIQTFKNEYHPRFGWGATEVIF